MTLTRTVKIDIVERTFRAEVEYNYHRGYAGSYFDPPEPAHVEIQKVTLLGDDDKPLESPDWLADLIAESEYVQDELIDYATEA
jgi:hypothetical protein